MDKYTAGRIEGMLAAARHYLENMAWEVRQATPAKKRHARLLMIGRALTELCDLSREIYDEHPRVNPDYEKEKRFAATRRKQTPAKTRTKPRR